jgi:hypothetical protein
MPSEVHSKAMSEDIPPHIQREARRAGSTPREYCISRIAHWRKMLEQVSEDYRELSDEEFQKRIEKEM